MGMTSAMPQSKVNAQGDSAKRAGSFAFTGKVVFSETLERDGRELPVRIRAFVDVEPGSLIVVLEEVRTEVPPPNGTSTADWPASWLDDLTDLEQEWLEGRAVGEAELLSRGAQLVA